MRAIVLDSHGSVADFRQVELPMPALREGDLRIKVRAASFNPIDVQIRRRVSAHGSMACLVLGRDLSGVVDAVHETVVGFERGDEVYSYVAQLASSGTYAEYVSVPEELVASKPARLSHLEAASVPVAGITATLALAKAGVSPTQSLFVIGGAGGVGSFVLSLARQLGVRRLMTTAGNAISRGYLTGECSLQDDQVVDYRDADFVARAVALNGGAFDTVLDLVGGSMLAAACRALALDGHLASVTDGPSRDDFELLFERNASFHAIGAHAYSLTTDRQCWRKYRRMLDVLAGPLNRGLLRPPRIENVGSLSVATVRRAHELLERHAVQGKLTMSMD